MKRFFLLPGILSLALIITCKSPPAVEPAQPTQPEPTALYTGDGGAGTSITILAPKATGLSKDQGYIPSLVQGEFVSNFTTYSGIAVLDRVRLQDQYDELNSGYYDDNSAEALDLGHLAPTTHILGGTITKTASGYRLQMQITKSADKTTGVTYSGTCTFEELDDLSGVRKASLDLLQKMKVELTEKGRTELTGAAASDHVNGQTALAQGIVAQQSGTVVQALSYYLQSTTFDPGLVEAASRVNIMSTNISSGNIGMDIRNDINWQKQWVARLKEAEDFYADYIKKPLPYYLVYSADIKQEGGTDYQRETATLSGVKVSVVPDFTWFIPINQVIATVRKGVNATGRTSAWGINWPSRSVSSAGLPGMNRSYAVTVELLNDQGVSIGKRTVNMSYGWSIDSGSFNLMRPRMDLYTEVSFPDVNANLITSRLSVKITSIDGIAAEQAGQQKGISILTEDAYERLPKIQEYGYGLKYLNGSWDRISINEAGVLTGYSGTGRREEVAIPYGYGPGPLVTSIGEKAFYEKRLTSVIIPPGVTSIGNEAFRTNWLTSVIIPPGVISIGDSAFSSNQLTSVVISSSVTSIGEDTFLFNKDLSKIVIPSGVAITKDPSKVNMIYFGADGPSPGFNKAYNKNGKKGGTYTRNGKKWTYQP